jgi:hyaluronoglucosaminidase
VSRSFPVRGIIEGFYGTPWTHAQRLDMIDFIAGIGMNTYVYAPKDDALLRRDWRSHYEADALAALGELITRCASRDIRFVYALSPGLSMSYASADDLRALVGKYAQVADLGVTAFALLLDDIPGELQHPADRDAFPSLVTAQIDLVGRLTAALPPESTLVVAPTQYFGRGDEEYITELGRGLDRSIDILWTGRTICSPVLEVVDAARFADATGHQPLYWDNFPVNDVAMTGELHIGPYLGRETGLLEWSPGVIANAMPAAEASKVGFASIAEYLADPEAFDPEAAWERAIARIAGPDVTVVREFADALRGSALCLDDSPRLAATLSRFAFDYDFGDRAQAVSDLAATAAHLSATATAMSEIANSAFLADARPWVDQYARAASALAVCADLLAAGPLDAAGRAQIMERLSDLRAHRRRVHGDLVDMFLSDLAHEYERDG